MLAKHSERRSPSVATGVVAAAAALFAALILTLRRFVTDDAYISLRYARNFAQGHGPVWNPGGEVVEGFSNPLLVLLEAIAFRIGIDGVLVARGLGVLAGFGLVVMCYLAGREVIGRQAAAAAAVIVAGIPGLAYWAVGGLETLPMALVLTVAALQLAREDGGPAARTGVLLALLPWIRPEGLALAGALVFCSEIRGLIDTGRRAATLRRLVWLAGLPLLSQVVLQGLRWALYGHMLPNSVIYKAGTGEFGEVTLKFLAENALLFPLAAVALVRLSGRARLLVVPAAVYLVASLTFLDSVNLFSRLVLPTLPLWVLLAAAGLPRRSWRTMTAATLIIVTLMLFVMPASLPLARAKAQDYRACKHLSRTQGGLWLRDRLGPGDTYAIGDAGLLPYVAGGTAIDVFGLNEPSLQETGSTSPEVRAEAVFAQQPRFLISSSRRRGRLRPIYKADRALVADPSFALYERRTVAGAPGEQCDYYLHIFERQSTGDAP